MGLILIQDRIDSSRIHHASCLLIVGSASGIVKPISPAIYKSKKQGDYGDSAQR